MICIITKLETNNKWKGKPLHKMVINKAKDNLNDIDPKFRFRHSTRAELKSLQKSFDVEFKKELPETTSEYYSFVNKFFKLKD